MTSFLDPSTSLALLQATQGDSKKSVSELKNAKLNSQLDEAAREFESVFITEMMKPMFEGIETDGMFGGGKGEEIFRGFLIKEYGSIMSQTGAVGIADQVRAAMVQMQAEADQRANAPTDVQTQLLAQDNKTPNLLQGALNDE